MNSQKAETLAWAVKNKVTHMFEKLWIAFYIIFYLIAARLTTLKKMTPYLGQQTSVLTETMPRIYSEKQHRILGYLQFAVPRMARYFPWECLCLPQAYACAKILQHYVVPYTFCIGASFLHENEKTFSVHAWVENQGKTIVGGQESRKIFSILPVFYIWNERKI